MMFTDVPERLVLGFVKTRSKTNHQFRFLFLIIHTSVMESATAMDCSFCLRIMSTFSVSFHQFELTWMISEAAVSPHTHTPWKARNRQLLSPFDNFILD